MPKGVPNRRYTPEFKKQVVETMQEKKLSCCETARQFEISDDKRVAAWERIYLEEGPEGFAVERRGRGSKGRPPKHLPKEVEEDLLAEVQRLRAENEYLRQHRTISSSASGGAFALKGRCFPLQYTKYCCGKAPTFNRKIPRRPLSPNYAVLP